MIVEWLIVYFIVPFSAGFNNTGSEGFILNEKETSNNKTHATNDSDPQTRLLQLQKASCNCGFMKDLDIDDLNEKSKATVISRRTNIKRSKTKGMRIFRGYSPKGLRPWMAFIDMTDYSGAGTIISKEYVLTAAHVVCGMPGFCANHILTAENTEGLSWVMKIITGTKDPSSFKESEGRQLHFVDTIYVHPEYESTNNDIAIIKIKGQFTFNENVNPICLIDPEIAGFKQGVVSGWGVNNVLGGGCLTRHIEPNPFNVCKNNFTFNGTIYEKKCVTSALIPSGDKLCDLFGENYPLGVDIVHIRKGDQLVRCYPPKAGDYGWCPIGKLVDVNDDDGDPEESFGYCSRDCFKEDLVQDFFEVVLDIVDPVVCEDFLLKSTSLNYSQERDICAAKEVVGNLTTVIFMRSKSGLKEYEKGQKSVKFYGGKDACQGDSGGPLYIYKKQSNENGTFYRAILIGIVSRGRLCAFRNKPGLFTKISFFLPWIVSIAQNSTC